MLHSRGRPGAQGAAVRRLQPPHPTSSRATQRCHPSAAPCRPPVSRRLLGPSEQNHAQKSKKLTIDIFMASDFYGIVFIVPDLLASAVAHRGSGFTFQVSQLMMTCAKTQRWGAQV